MKYGSSDAGRTVHLQENEKIDRVFQQLGNTLHLKKHKTRGSGDKEMYGPVDVEGHVTDTNQFFIIDTARLFPPEKPNGKFPSQIYWQLLRPELLLSTIPLNSDTFSPFATPETAEEDQYEVEFVSRKIYEERIPTIAKSIITNTEQIFPLISDVKSIMHSTGINLRHLIPTVSKVLSQKS